MRLLGLLCVALVAGCDRYMEPPDSAAIDTRQETLEGALGTTCGNGVREAGEQCDDGAQVNLDGCSATCQFEQLHRINYVQMQFAGDPVCPLNALGGAIVGSTARSELQSNLDAGIKDGSLTALLQLLGLDDLAGNDDRSVGVGVLGGTPVAGTGYDGANDLDWWYQIDSTSVDALRNPLSILTGNITTRLLTTQPSNLDLPFQSGTTLAAMRASNARLSVVTGASIAPLLSGGAPPGHLASEHLDPTLVSFATAGDGRLCGNLSAKSLSQVPIPAPLLAGGLLSCMEGYGPSNSLLDMIVGGCTVVFVRQTRATQPDTEDPMAPPAGAGPGYTLIRNSERQVSGCIDASGAAVDLETCLNDAAYSAFVKFASGRVIAR
jgi:cysteine-rich repeat protein